MFEALGARAAMAAQRRAEARAGEIAEALAGEVPAGVAVRRGADGVEIEGRGIARRFALEPRLRGLLGRLR